ncbi:16S rRNA (guanine966-N2)-methyltransferase [Nitrosomonas aestuarii]|uniref:16S rRNA (Guanine966-N2)-methyltransferase n=1 Tax=Nitrosomonas aestuarii TaxID=52441 RepID=A0A1I4D714_9PROT|nr:16S rRNA (guanine(966)-N(2))-methyltransferase RsmD [Nitrosomonas aestuarii]SFK88629.1 16S rRNA (guanine966-N2)-methyltransferase [Nitrosomonas aestuarii]
MALTQGKLRIIGGCWRSRMITFPYLPDLRPTPDRVRETLFNWLGQDLDGMCCLDLFAGSGALGFEAASRGAAKVIMVESDNRVYKALLENRDKLKANQIELVNMDATVFLASDKRQFDVVFLDPPYRLQLVPEIMSLLPPLLTKRGQVYLETKTPWIPDQQWQIWRKGKAGKVNYQLLELHTVLDNHG